MVPKASRAFRVLVVDDSIVPRAAAKTLLAATKGLRFCGEATTGEEAIQKMSSLKPDLILMDVHMPGMDGPAATKAMRELNPAVRIVAWTVSEASDDLLRMMQAGCSGYVLKDAGPQELEHALLAAIRSETPVPRKMIPEVLRRIGENTPLSRARTTALTSREMQILRGAAKGHTSKKLAHDAGLALPSVETHLRNIFRKLGASNRGEAVSTALKLGLITLADL
jgi:two-component system nitrate/nitrite response regulator NarL